LPLNLAALPTRVQTWTCISGDLNLKLCKSPSIEAHRMPRNKNVCGEKFDNAAEGQPFPEPMSMMTTSFLELSCTRELLNLKWLKARREAVKSVSL